MRKAVGLCCFSASSTRLLPRDSERDRAQQTNGTNDTLYATFDTRDVAADL